MSYQSKKKQAKMTRRQALAACGAGIAAPMLVNPMSILMRGLVDGFISSAQAADSIIQPRTLINYHCTDAPNPWHSLLPMSPYANRTPARGAHMNTGITNGSLVYQTKAVTSSAGTLYMPNLWSSNIATPSGTAPMTNLIENMLIMRGIQGNSANSHGEGRREMTRPVGTRPSLMGLVADASNLPIQSVITTTADGLSTAFKAVKAGQTVVTNHDDPMTQILRPFDKRGDSLNSTFVTRRQAKDMMIKKALASLGSYAASSAPGAESLFAMRNSAELFLQNGVAGALAAYPIALAKYRKLISDCGSLASLKTVGVTDRAIPLPSEGPDGIGQMAIAGTLGYAQNSDAGSIIHAGVFPYLMAENFAIAEILVMQNLSSSIALAGNNIFGLNYENPVRFGTRAAFDPYGTWNIDEHNGGTYTSLIINSYFYQCLYSCVNELISMLKSKNMFNESVIFITSDFGRAEEMGSWGTRHADEACVFQVYSGAIAAPVVIGNISNGSPGPLGDYGQNRPVAGTAGGPRPLNIYDATSTVAALARVTPPSDNNPSLVNATGVPNVEKATETA